MPGSPVLAGAAVALWLCPAVAATRKLPAAPAVACAPVSTAAGGAEHADRVATAATIAGIPAILGLRVNIALLKQAAHTFDGHGMPEPAARGKTTTLQIAKETRRRASRYPLFGKPCAGVL
jgi:hypothetical protein